MSKYIVSALKYRPQRFDEVVGQQHVTQTLKNALRSAHLAHAFLFCGPRGVGKTTCARILAKVINCEHPVDQGGEPCNECSSCKAFNESASFNIMELDAASNNSVEHIRTLIEQVRFQPQHGKYKVFIIDEVHMLSQQAFNAFLKTLEEPPEYAIFILATTEKHKIIPTILSRCQIFDFRSISVEDIVAHLQYVSEQEAIATEPEALYVIAEKAGGALRDALSIYDRMLSFDAGQVQYQDVIEQLNVLDNAHYFKLTELLLAEDVAGVLLLLNEVIQNGFDPGTFILDFAKHLRNLLVAKDTSLHSLLTLSKRWQQRYQEQAQLVETAVLLTYLQLVTECDLHYREAQNKRLHVEMYLIKMAYVHRTVHTAVALPDHSKEKTQAAKKKVESPTSVVAMTPPAAKATDSGSDIMSEPPPMARDHTRVQDPVVSVSSPVKPHHSSSRKPSATGAFKLDSYIMKEPDEAYEGVSEKIPLTMEKVEAAIKSYVSKLTSRFTKKHLSSATIQIELPNILEMKCSSEMAKETVLKETGLMDHLRQEFRRDDLQLAAVVDEELAARMKTIKKRNRPVTDREKYLHMASANPAVELLRKKFDLRPD